MPQIRTEDKPLCPLCGGQGEYLYEEMADDLFNVPGLWNLKRCVNLQCALLWLDPVPAAEDTGKLYLRYYTHEEGGAGTEKKLTLFKFSYSLLKKLLFINRERNLHDHLFLRGRRTGKLLEIGCGSGRKLSRLKKRGWNVEGVEIDRQAAEIARSKFNLNIHVGHLFDFSFPESSYDVIYMNHVVEHLAEPVRFLAECRRLLKPGGQLIVVTPNAQSYGHHRLGSRWRGVEPPRHFHIFSAANLGRLAHLAGFSRYSIRTSAGKAESFARGTLEIQKNRGEISAVVPSRDRFPERFQLSAQIRWLLDRKSGEECILKAEK